MGGCRRVLVYVDVEHARLEDSTREQVGPELDDMTREEVDDLEAAHRREEREGRV